MGVQRVDVVYKLHNNERQGEVMTFYGEDAVVVANALFDAEARGALGTHFQIGDQQYWLRTDKYLYWTDIENYEDPGF